MKVAHIRRCGALAAALVLAACTETREPVGLHLSAEGMSLPGTTYSGDATVLQAQVLDLATVTLVRAGPLPESGGAEEASLLTVRIPGDATGGVLDLAANVAHASTIAEGNASRSEASVADVQMIVAGNTVSAAFLRARAQATCQAGTATASGSSELAGLVISGQAIVVTGEPNQTVDLPGLRVVINEQRGFVNGNRADMTVNALHVTASVPLTGQQLADVIISQAHADISCGAPPPPPPVCRDFMTGGGWMTGTPSG
ncbi:MAG: choice-of-anchor P family protein, partial [Dehalococcoidia bacterium]